MRYLYLLIAIFLPVTSEAADVALAPFASSNCPQQTFYTDFRSGLTEWNVTNDSGPSWINDNGVKSVQSSQAVQAASDGLQLRVQPGGMTGLQGSYLDTTGKWGQFLGYFEATMEIQGGEGDSVAFWIYTTRPGSVGEIDIAETNGFTMGSRLHSAYTKGETYDYTRPLKRGRHVYAVSWTKETVTWFEDGKETHSAPTPPDLADGSPFDIRLDNMAGGAGAWMGEAPSGATYLTVVDTVRVFKDMESALACVPSASLTTRSTLEQPKVRMEQQDEQYQPQVPPIIAQSAPPSPTIVMPDLTDPSSLSAEIAATQRQIQETEKALSQLPALINQARSQRNLTSSKELVGPATKPMKDKESGDDENDAENQ